MTENALRAALIAAKPYVEAAKQFEHEEADAQKLVERIDGALVGKPKPPAADAVRDALVNALKLGLEYWKHRQQRYKNRSPAWVEAANDALAQAAALSPAPLADREAREALEFYADPFAWKKLHDPDDVVRVPDFYSETSFGDTAAAALAAAPLATRAEGDGWMSLGAAPGASVPQKPLDLSGIGSGGGISREPAPLADREALEAAVRAAKLALFVIRKQGIMPNASWENGFNKDLATAEAALAAQPVVAGEAWQPIETAPKDGTFIILNCPEDGSRWWASWQGHQWFGVDEYGLTRAGASFGDPEIVTGWFVTHWMPLPRAALLARRQGGWEFGPQAGGLSTLAPPEARRQETGETIILSPDEHARLTEHLDNPPAPNAKLTELLSTPPAATPSPQGETGE